MNPARPTVTHVAVREGKIIATGTKDDIKGWGDYTLDESFSDKVIMPGLVEGHCHLMAGRLNQRSVRMSRSLPGALIRSF